VRKLQVHLHSHPISVSLPTAADAYFATLDGEGFALVLDSSFLRLLNDGLELAIGEMESPVGLLRRRRHLLVTLRVLAPAVVAEEGEASTPHRSLLSTSFPPGGCYTTVASHTLPLLALDADPRYEF